MFLSLAKSFDASFLLKPNSSIVSSENLCFAIGRGDLPPGIGEMSTFSMGLGDLPAGLGELPTVPLSLGEFPTV